jgi:hypothetical protein
MNISKLRTFHVLIAGAVACVIVAVGVYFFVIQKTEAKIGPLNTRMTTAQQTIDQKNSFIKAKEQAQADLDLAMVKYNHYLTAKMPPISFEDRSFGMIALWKEQAEVLGPMLKKWSKKSSDYHLKFTGDFVIPPAPANPNAIDGKMIVLKVGSFSVTGSFNNILNYIQSWNKFNRLVQVDGLSLKGTSPNLTGSFALTVYIMPRDGLGDPIPMAGSGSSSGGGMGGMMGGGMMGGAMPMPPMGAGMAGAGGAGGAKGSAKSSSD